MSLNIAQIEEIKSILLEIPDLIKKYDRHDLSFTEGVKDWLTKMERALTNNRLPQGASIATFQSLLISVERDIIPEGYTFRKRLTKRKMLEVVSAEILRKAEELIRYFLQINMQRIEEAERLARQIAIIVQRKNLLATIPQPLTHTQKLQILWNTISSDSDLSTAALHLEVLLGKNDAMIIIDRQLPELV
jgi:hypothetical protein